MAIKTRDRRFRASAALAAIVVALLTSVVVATHASARSTTPRQGKGYAVAGGDFVGFYLSSDGRKLYCLSPRKALPVTVTLRRTSHISGVSKTQSSEIAYALGRWGNASTNTAAAAESQVLNTIAGNMADVARRARQLPKAVSSLVAQHLADTHRYYGPYVTTVRTPKALLPGQQAVGTVIITSIPTGRRLPHIPVQISGSSNVALPHHIVTNGEGIGTFTYRVTDIGEVHVVATATDLPSTGALQNQPPPWAQHMVTPVPPVSTRGSASFRASPSGFTNNYACTTTCNGQPTTVVSACAAANGRASRIVFYYGSRTTAIEYPASKTRTCKSTSFTTRDGEHVYARWQFLTSHGWSKPENAAGTFVVDCPAAPAIGVTMTADCTKASLVIGLANLGSSGTWTPLVNSSKHRMVLVIGGATQKRIYAAQGKTAVYTATASCTSPSTYTMQAGVQRANGDYNYGPVGSITTPGAPS